MAEGGRISDRYLSGVLSAAGEVPPAGLGEEVASLAESAPWVTYPLGRTPAEKCEACGTPVSVVAERALGTPPESAAAPALWEPGPWRKHTPRRCAAMRKEAGW